MKKIWTLKELKWSGEMEKQRISKICAKIGSSSVPSLRLFLERLSYTFIHSFWNFDLKVIIHELA